MYSPDETKIVVLLGYRQHPDYIVIAHPAWETIAGQDILCIPVLPIAYGSRI